MIRLTSLMILAASLLVTTACSTTVQPGERGLILRSSGLDQEPLKDGRYWTAPWNDVHIYDVRWQHYAENVDAWSMDNVQVVVKAAIVLRPIPQEVYALAQTVGTEYYPRVVQPEFQAAVRSVVAMYPALTVTEKSAEIAQKVQMMVMDKLKDRHVAIQSVALSDVDLPQLVLTAIEQKQAKEQQKEQKEFELLIAGKDAEIARARAKGEGDALQILAEGQAQAQETITKTLTPQYLRYKLYDSQNARMVLLPDDLKLPVGININPGEQQPSAPLSSAESAGKLSKPEKQPPMPPPSAESAGKSVKPGEEPTEQRPYVE
jgi:regulator of protease activity HflC (stomatin/prohibitin superfamily)